MKIIKMIRPKPRIDDVSACDSCGVKFASDREQFRSLDFSRFLCLNCKRIVNASLIGIGVDTKGYWKKFILCVMTAPESEKQYKPYRPRGKRVCTAAKTR